MIMHASGLPYLDSLCVAVLLYMFFFMTNHGVLLVSGMIVVLFRLMLKHRNCNCCEVRISWLCSGNAATASEASVELSSAEEEFCSEVVNTSSYITKTSLCFRDGW